LENENCKFNMKSLTSWIIYDTIRVRLVGQNWFLLNYVTCQIQFTTREAKWLGM
jgi:hypothetical protein